MATDTTPLGRCTVCDGTVIMDEPSVGGGPDGEPLRHSGCGSTFSADSLAYVRRYYGVPANVGQRVIANGRDGVIVGGENQYILVKLDGTAETPRPWHPTWEMEYVDA